MEDKNELYSGSESSSENSEDQNIKLKLERVNQELLKPSQSQFNMQ